MQKFLKVWGGGVGGGVSEPSSLHVLNAWVSLTIPACVLSFDDLWAHFSECLLEVRAVDVKNKPSINIEHPANSVLFSPLKCLGNFFNYEFFEKNKFKISCKLSFLIPSLKKQTHFYTQPFI